MMRDSYYGCKSSDPNWSAVKSTWLDPTLKLFLSELRRNGFDIVKSKAGS